MKRYIKTSAFITIISILLAAIIGLTTWVIVLNVKNNSLEKRVITTSIKNDKTNSLNEELKTANENLKITNAHLEKENVDVKYKNEELKKEIADINKLLNKVSAKELIAAEQNLALENTPHAATLPTKKVCYLTFDDGPSDRTLEILEILDRYDVKATFFVVGTSKLEYLPYIVEGGHAIGLHSNTHQYNSIYKSTTAYFNDLNALSDKIYERVGVHTKVIRFPGGSSNGVSKSACKGIMTRLVSQVQIKGYGYFDWNVDSGDATSNNVTSETIVNNVLNGAINKNAICVLMHDYSTKQTTVEALPKIIEGLSEMGYTFEVLTENAYGFHHTVQN